MKTLITLVLIFSVNLSFAEDPKIYSKVKFNDQSSPGKTAQKRVFVGGDIGATFGDYTQVSINPMIGYRISPQVSTGLQFVYNHSWQLTNEGQTNQTTLQSNTYGGNVFLQYNPLPEFFLKGEFEYDSYENFATTQNTTISQAVPFLFLGAGYSKAISRVATFNAGIKVDVLNNKNSPYDDFTPFFYAGIGIGI